MDELTRLRTEAQTVGSEAGKLQESIPGLLSGLKTNLTSIFSKDNPMMAERENALQTFLNVPSQTRAELLPGNQPIIAGRALNYSPTQQESIVTGRQNAALVPLAGLNQSIVGQYGNLMDMLAQTGDIYKTQVLGAQNQAAVAQQAFQNALAQEQERRQAASAGGGGLDLSALIAAMLGGQQQDSGADEWEVVETPQAPAAPTGFRSQPLQAEGPGFWDSLLGLIGATPKQGLEQPSQPGGLNLSGYNFGNTPIKLGV